MLDAQNKEDVVAELIHALSRSVPEIDEQEIATAVWDREQLLSTRIAPMIAVPHAQIPGMQGSYLAVGKSRRGIEYDVRNQERVHLVFLLIGGEGDHLQILGELARVLQRPGLIQQLLVAADRHEIYRLLTAPAPAHAVETDSHTAAIMSEYAGQLAERVQARVVMVHGSGVSAAALSGLRRDKRTVVLVGSEDESSHQDSALYDHYLMLPFKGLNRSNQVEMTTLMALSKGIVHKGDKVVNVFGLTGRQLDTIVLSDISRDFKLFFSMQLDSSNDGVAQQVFLRAMQIMAELAQEGREGKAVGTLFVLGDYEQVRSSCQQMVINPFQGYAETERNILDPSLSETMKEFSRIDGAFLIRGDGVVMSAGTYLRTNSAVTGLTPGLGARHTAAAGITLNSDALAICLSESTRQISLFRSGERIMVV